MSHQLIKEEEGVFELPDASEDEQSHLYILNSLTQHLSSPGNTTQMTSALVTSAEPPNSVSHTIASALQDVDKLDTTCNPALLTRPEHPGTLHEQSTNPLDENMVGKPTEILANMQWLPPVYDHGPPTGHNGFGMRMPYFSPYYPYSAPPYPYGVPPGYFPEVPPPTRAVPPYMRHAHYGSGHPYMDPGLMARYPGSYMSLPGPTRPGAYMPYHCPQPAKPLRSLKQQTANKTYRKRNMTSLLVDGRQLNYNWPPPQVRMPQGLDVKKSEAGDVDKETQSELAQTQMSAAVIVVASALVNTDDEMTTEQRMEQIHGMCVTPIAMSHAPRDTPIAVSHAPHDTPFALSHDPHDAPIAVSYAPRDTPITVSNDPRNAPVAVIHDPRDTPIAVSHALRDTPIVDNTKHRASKVTYDMLQEAMKDKPDKAVKIAKTLFSKRMLTLYGWLYPSTAKRDIKNSIDKLWDRLPASEKEFYLSQAEGRFGSRSTGVMVNPQLAALPGLPDDLRFSPNLSHHVQDNQVTHMETEDAVRHLLASDVTRPVTELKRKRQLQPVESQAKRDKTPQEVAKKRPYRNMRSTRSSQLEDVNNNDVVDDVKQQSPPLGLQLLAEVASQRSYEEASQRSYEEASQRSNEEASQRSYEEASQRSYEEASEEPLVSYACHEVYAEHEVVLSNGGTELTNEDIAGLGGLDMLGLIADSKMEMIRHQLDNTNKHYDNQWYFPSTSHDVYATNDVLR